MTAPSNPDSREGTDPQADTDGGSLGKTKRPLLFLLGVATVVAVIATIGLLAWQDSGLRQAKVAFENGDAKYAHFLLNRFLEKHPEHQKAMAMQAQTLVALGSPDEAIALFDQVGAATEEDVHAWARALMMKGQWSHALPLLKQVLAFNPHEPDALYEAAACQVRLGQLSEALTNAEQLTKIPDQAARGYVFVGTILGDLGNHEQAAAAFSEVLKLEPNADNLQVTPDEFFLQYGRTFQQLGKPAESLAPLKQSAAVRQTPEALILLGNAALQLGKPGNAAQAWERAVRLDPTAGEAREGLANLALQNGQGDVALKWLQPLENDPVLLSSTAYMFQRAYTLLKDDVSTRKWQEITAKKRRAEEIRRDLNNLMKDSPDTFWARAARAHRFAERGNWTEAEVLLKRLLKEGPDETFIIELADAVFRRAELPPIEKIPIEHF
jgi:tetratricopeptide (TPR) repeat protein